MTTSPVIPLQEYIKQRQHGPRVTELIYMRTLLKMQQRNLHVLKQKRKEEEERRQREALELARQNGTAAYQAARAAVRLAHRRNTRDSILFRFDNRPRGTCCASGSASLPLYAPRSEQKRSSASARLLSRRNGVAVI